MQVSWKIESPLEEDDISIDINANKAKYSWVVYVVFILVIKTLCHSIRFEETKLYSAFKQIRVLSMII